MTFSISGNNILKSELLDRTMNYHIFLQQGASITEPVWSEPYEDAFGAGWIITVSFPIYSTNEEGIKLLLGVAAIDVTMSSLEAFGQSEEEVLNFLHQDIPCY